MSETIARPSIEAMRRATAAAAEAAAAEPLSVQEETLRILHHSGAAFVTGLTKAQSEIVDFVAERIRQDVEMQAELLSCRTYEEVRDLQIRFFKTAMDQYAAEATKLMNISSEMLARAPQQVG
jgi:hypothetical protein